MVRPTKEIVNTASRMARESVSFQMVRPKKGSSRRANFAAERLLLLIELSSKGLLNFEVREDLFVQTDVATLGISNRACCKVLGNCFFTDECSTWENSEIHAI